MEVVSAAIKPKGRIVTQFLEYFAPLLFPEKSELISEARRVLEDDKRRLKEDEFLSLDDALELFYDEICRQNPELRTVLCVAPDLKRTEQPYRIALRALEGYVDGINLRIYGDVNPIETLRDNNVNFAIASSDLLLVKFISLISGGIDLRDSGKILSCLPEDTTTMEYGFPLNINQARHMLITNFPADISVREDGIPLPEEGVEIAVNGEYYLIYSRIFNGRRYRLTEGEKVEPFVLRRDGMKKYGIEIVSSGRTLIEESKRNGSGLAVCRNPVYESSGIILLNDARREGSGSYRKIVSLIREMNQQIKTPEETTTAFMEKNLERYLI